MYHALFFFCWPSFGDHGFPCWRLLAFMFRSPYGVKKNKAFIRGLPAFLEQCYECSCWPFWKNNEG